MPRMSKERLEEIKELRADDWFIYNPNSDVNEAIDELLSEIDALQEELALVTKLKDNALDQVEELSTQGMGKKFPFSHSAESQDIFPDGFFLLKCKHCGKEFKSDTKAHFNICPSCY